MKKIILSLLFSPILVLSQKSVMEFSTTQKIILQQFLQANPSVTFTSENYLYNQNYFGYNFKPYYNFNDFNGDGKKDFAVLLSKGRNKQLLLIFNNINNKSYKLAHKEEFSKDSSAFINRSAKWSKNHLYYGILETSTMICFRPAGNGYISEYCGR